MREGEEMVRKERMAKAGRAAERRSDKHVEGTSLHSHQATLFQTNLTAMYANVKKSLELQRIKTTHSVKENSPLPVISEWVRYTLPAVQGQETSCELTSISVMEIDLQRRRERGPRSR